MSTKELEPVTDCFPKDEPFIGAILDACLFMVLCVICVPVAAYKLIRFASFVVWIPLDYIFDSLISGAGDAAINMRATWLTALALFKA